MHAHSHLFNSRAFIPITPKRMWSLRSGQVRESTRQGPPPLLSACDPPTPTHSSCFPPVTPHPHAYLSSRPAPLPSSPQLSPPQEARSLQDDTKQRIGGVILQSACLRLAPLSLTLIKTLLSLWIKVPQSQRGLYSPPGLPRGRGRSCLA